MTSSETPCEFLPEAEIRKRIKSGNLRRKRAKQGTVKRLIGNCNVLLASLCFFTAASVASVGSGPTW